jgi:hypothetical protein
MRAFFVEVDGRLLLSSLPSGDEALEADGVLICELESLHKYDGFFIRWYWNLRGRSIVWVFGGLPRLLPVLPLADMFAVVFCYCFDYKFVEFMYPSFSAQMVVER